jgi:hypothetical protein
MTKFVRSILMILLVINPITATDTEAQSMTSNSASTAISGVDRAVSENNAFGIYTTPGSASAINVPPVITGLI